MTIQVRAAVLDRTPAPGHREPLRMATLELDDPTADEVVVRIQAAGLCHSDLHEIDGTFATEPPIVLGHEAAGVVEAVGSAVTEFRPGDTVVSCLSVFCGACRYCTNGQLVLCERREALSHDRGRPRLRDETGRPVRPTAGIGAFADAMVVHRHALVRIDPDVDSAVASILGCAVTTGLGAVFRSARVAPGQDVVVIGAGGVGLLAVQGARLAGAARIVAVDVHAAKLDTARSFGATHIVDARTEDVVARVRGVTGDGADHVIEAVGSAATVEQALALLRPGGTVTVVGMVPGGRPITITGSDFFLSEKHLQGSFMGSNQFRTDIPRYLEFYRQGRLMLDEMITTVTGLESIDDGFATLAGGRAGRVVVRIEPGGGDEANR